ncbi:MAG: IS110 family transposase [Bacteroidales bacterium]|jgi:transposase|nr:IS110 family transposase [Bacteroidales bacterium]
MEAQVKKIDFTGQNIYVGFDTHLKSWKVTVMAEGSIYKTFTQPPQPEVLNNYLKNNFPGGIYHTAYEAGFCGYWIHDKLLSFGIKSIVVNPADIPTTDKERVQKEDKRDSRKIARSLSSGTLMPIYVPSIHAQRDRSLLRTRIMLVRDLARYKNRIKSFLYFYGISIAPSFSNPQSHWSNRFMLWLESLEIDNGSGKEALRVLINECKNLRTSILSINRQIRQLSNTERYKDNVKLLKSVPGIGLLTAMIILTELEAIERFSNIDKLCGYIGLVPSTKSSGEKDKTGDITPRGHNVLRTAIIESSWTAIRNDPSLMHSYLTFIKRMESNKAIIKIAKKLLSRIRYVLMNKKPYVCLIEKETYKNKNMSETVTNPLQSLN